MKHISYLIVLFLLSPGVSSQEIITELQVNPVIKLHREITKPLKTDKSSSRIPVILPFRDDFSSPAVYPDTARWMDNFVFINTDYPINPVTVGVATFDAINDSGSLYHGASFFPFQADYLTSRPIRLDSLFIPSHRAITLSDSLYLSFYYQPQGIGNAPETDDSLVLEFLVQYRADTIIDTAAVPHDTIYIDKWTKVWGTGGISIDTFFINQGKYWKQVLIPITDSATYYRNDFQFRFRNYCSLANNNIPSWAANCDQWHIDYVYLDIDRSYIDTSYHDVGFMNRQPSLLKNYESMPWTQFIVNPSVEMVDSSFTPINNLNDTLINVPLFFKITDLSNHQEVYNPFPGGDVSILQSLKDTVIQRSFNYTFQSAATPFADFEVLKYIKPSTDDNNSNDTIRFYQRFYNYYAYDDGTAEAGYGLKPAHSRLALKFTLNHPDTLQAVQMFFNQTLNNASQKYFYLVVWDNNSGIPGNILYKENVVKPEYETGLNRFHNYVLDHPVPVSGTFYVGWEQTTDDNLNIGFDLNKNSQNRIYYNIFGTWTNSLYEGSLMIHPVLGALTKPHVDIPEHTDDISILIYPNPVKDDMINIRITRPDILPVRKEAIVIRIFDTFGKQLIETPYMESINVNTLENGLYFINIRSKAAGINITEKFILTR